ncbi:putative membrane protein, partial [Bacteroides fragilis str. 3986 N(B)19]
MVKKVQAILFLSLIVFMIVIYCLTNDFFCIIYSAA